MNKFGYKDWWEGNICLNTCVIVTKKDQEKPNVVGWDSIIESEKRTIREKQSEIFHQQIDERSEVLRTDFNKKYNSSRLPDTFLKREIELMKQILFGQLKEFDDHFVTTHRKISFEKQDLFDIQHYAKHIFLNGNELVIDFIHSPNCKHQYTDRPPNQVRAEIYWNHLQFLINLNNNLNTERDGGRSNVEALVHREPENPFPLIFINGYSYEMFEELRKLTVGNNSKRIAADYGFIFHKMKYHSRENESLGLNIGVSEPTFINFLIKDLKIAFDSERLPNRNPDNKQALYNTTLNKYVKLIEENQKNSHPKE